MSSLEQDSSTSNGITPPNTITSLDCKILQYQYAIVKLETFLKLIKHINDNQQFPLMHYIPLLSGNVFAINDKAFDSKIEGLSNFALFPKNSLINISPLVSHIPYDTADTPVVALETLPELSMATSCLRAFESLCTTCIQGYRKRLASAKEEKKSYYPELERIIADEILPNELNSEDFILKQFDFVDEDFLEATLIDIDIKQLFIICRFVEQILNKVKLQIEDLKKGNIETYQLHRTFLLTLHLNETYTSFRRYGRKIYISNYEHLTDPRFQMQSKSQSNFRGLLSNMSDLFNCGKKNGTLIANLTRLIRASAEHEVNAKNVQLLINFVNQGYNMLEGSIQKLKQFGLSWILTELKFRRVYNLPKKNLFDFFQTIPEFKQSPTNTPTPSIVVPTTAPAPTIVSPGNNKLEAFPSITTNKQPSKLRAPSPVRRSRSSSNSSITSLPTINGQLAVPTNGSSARSLSPKSPPPAVYSQDNASTSVIPSPTKPTTVTTGNRRRSNSQPIGNAGATAAAMAITRTGSISSPLQNELSRRRSNGSIGSPLRKQTPIKEEPKKQEKPKKKTDATAGAASAISNSNTNNKVPASQRLQQHLKQGAKNGVLMTQTAAKFTTMTFDPNFPSKAPIRKYLDPVPISAPVPVPVSSPVPVLGSAGPAAVAAAATSPPKPTQRESITKRNTRANSIVISESELSDMTSSTVTSSSSSVNGSNTTKKVRFTGVPKYSEAEDAPTKYSHTILKNFGVFRKPYEKGDQLLKEESMSFRHRRV
ncbi:hypothetical protein JA1_003576 [Spathaspora sp. JA1]|nr:hypothetical protein JA1_003576 [Spathaspora sp. JA1]